MRSVMIEVEEHEALPDGCLMRFSALDEPRPVRRVQYELRDGTPAVCAVEGRDEADAPVPAWCVMVDDSSAGQSLLVGGGAHGLRLSPVDGGEAWTEAYLLLTPEAALTDQ